MTHHNVQCQCDGGACEIERQPRPRVRLCYAPEHHQARHLTCKFSKNVYMHKSSRRWYGVQHHTVAA
jgi:hypothetical protein